MADDNVVDFYNNRASYTPPCCRPGGRCTHESSPERIEELRAALTEVGMLKP